MTPGGLDPNASRSAERSPAFPPGGVRFWALVPFGIVGTGNSATGCTSELEVETDPPEVFKRLDRSERPERADGSGDDEVALSDAQGVAGGSFEDVVPGTAEGSGE